MKVSIIISTFNRAQYEIIVVGNGLKDPAQIADQLEISIDTIRTYLRRIYEKLHVQSRTEAVAKYLGH